MSVISYLVSQLWSWGPKGFQAPDSKAAAQKTVDHLFPLKGCKVHELWVGQQGSGTLFLSPCGEVENESTAAQGGRKGQNTTARQKK